MKLNTLQEFTGSKATIPITVLSQFTLHLDKYMRQYMSDIASDEIRKHCATHILLYGRGPSFLYIAWDEVNDKYFLELPGVEYCESLDSLENRLFKFYTNEYPKD